MDQELMCRTCLTKTPKCISVFTAPNFFGTTVALSKMIMACAPVDITMDDGLPTKICENCLKQLQFSFLFRMRVLQADEKLRNYVRKNLVPRLQPISEGFLEPLAVPFEIQNNQMNHVLSMDQILHSAAHDVDPLSSVDPFDLSRNFQNFMENQKSSIKEEIKTEEIEIKDEPIQIDPLMPIEEVMLPSESEIVQSNKKATNMPQTSYESTISTYGQSNTSYGQTYVNIGPGQSIPIMIPQFQVANQTSTTNVCLPNTQQLQFVVSCDNGFQIPTTSTSALSSNGQQLQYVVQCDNGHQVSTFPSSGAVNNLVQLTDEDKRIIKGLIQKQGSKISVGSNDKYIIIKTPPESSDNIDKLVSKITSVIQTGPNVENNDVVKQLVTHFNNAQKNLAANNESTVSKLVTSISNSLNQIAGGQPKVQNSSKTAAVDKPNLTNSSQNYIPPASDSDGEIKDSHCDCGKNYSKRKKRSCSSISCTSRGNGNQLMVNLEQIEKNAKQNKVRSKLRGRPIGTYKKTKSKTLKVANTVNIDLTSDDDKIPSSINSVVSSSDSNTSIEKDNTSNNKDNLSKKPSKQPRTNTQNVQPTASCIVIDDDD